MKLQFVTYQNKWIFYDILFVNLGSLGDLNEIYNSEILYTMMVKLKRIFIKFEIYINLLEKLAIPGQQQLGSNHLEGSIS